MYWRLEIFVPIMNWTELKLNTRVSLYDTMHVLQKSISVYHQTEEFIVLGHVKAVRAHKEIKLQNNANYLYPIPNRKFGAKRAKKHTFKVTQPCSVRSHLYIYKYYNRNRTNLNFNSCSYQGTPFKFT